MTIEFKLYMLNPDRREQDLDVIVKESQVSLRCPDPFLVLCRGRAVILPRQGEYLDMFYSFKPQGKPIKYARLGRVERVLLPISLEIPEEESVPTTVYLPTIYVTPIFDPPSPNAS